MRDDAPKPLDYARPAPPPRKELISGRQLLICALVAGMIVFAFCIYWMLAAG